jgi:hypothetical protein
MLLYVSKKRTAIFWSDIQPFIQVHYVTELPETAL